MFCDVFLVFLCMAHNDTVDVIVRDLCLACVVLLFCSGIAGGGLGKILTFLFWGYLLVHARFHIDTGNKVQAYFAGVETVL